MASLLKGVFILLIATSAMVNFKVLASVSPIAKSFEANQIVPNLIPKAPVAYLTVKYPSGVEVSEGNELTPTQVKDVPNLTWEADQNQFYTVSMTDPDAPSRKDPISNGWHHWIVGNVPGFNVSAGETLYEYIGSGPPQGTSLHRYVFLVYKQPGKLTFDEPRLTNRSGDKRANFSIASFAKKYNLGDPVAGNFFQAQYDDYVPILYKQLGV